MAQQAEISIEERSDPELVAMALARDPAGFRAIMRRYNRRLFRIARGILRDDAMAEDALQDAYLKAFRHLADFQGTSAFSTWLTRIVMNEALGRLRKARRTPEMPVDTMQGRILDFPTGSPIDNPETSMAQRQILKLVEEATDSLPEEFRLVFIARVIEEMSVEETAEMLSLKPETVRSRLHRARALLRRQLDEMIGPIAMDAFPFAGWKCDRLTEKVMRALMER
ncbi:RNA polymerase sigma-70 factor (ECF subfamily) [Rhizobium sp. BK316]|uniref:RNA polymerase sigma factor n=1 Tax=Rhizobium sp. BK316 TaxID=2587053 RepID=UPI001617B770|nr:RNA polymerase sigma factor [Rhizobium sp. BK316]MBB3412099.1 RNA polymerase sigma-70 factor (ECF subfamily) [Rhizobium sp. BK316]